MTPRTTLTLLALATLLSLGATQPTSTTKPTHSPEFLALVPDPTALSRLSTDHRFTEGPTWLPREGVLVFSDIPKSQQHILLLGRDPAQSPSIPDRIENGQVLSWKDNPDWKPVSYRATTRPFRDESYWANGTTLDSEGRLVVCQQAARNIVRCEPADKSNGLNYSVVTVLADNFNGKKFNAPNDAVYTHAGTLIFTDPPYGPAKGKDLEIDHCGVYQLTPDGKLTELVADMKAPNGVALSPDDKTLYISDTGKGQPGPVRAFTLTDDGRAIDGRLFYQTPKGAPDGMRTDSNGNLWTSAGDGIHIVAPDGHLLGIIKTPETPANLTFGPTHKQGDKELTTLFITAQKSIYAIPVTAKPSR